MLEGCTPWPDEFAARYRAAGYWRDLTLAEMLDESIREHGSRIAIVDGERRVSYSQLGQSIDRLAVQLAEAGLASLERVVFQLPNTLEFVVAFFALQRIGVIPVMALASHRLTEIRHFTEHSQAVGYFVADRQRGFDFRDMAQTLAGEFACLREVFVSGDARPGQHALDAMIEREPDAGHAAALLSERRPDPDEVALMLLSGGTTGLPKLIPRTHNDYAYNARQCGATNAFGPGTVLLTLLPLAHNYNLACPGILGILTHGGTVVLSAEMDAETVFPLIEREGVTNICAAVPLIATWVNSPVPARCDLSSLRAVMSGGARLPEELRRKVETVFACTFVECYGTSEGLIMQTRLDDADAIRFESSGRPVSPGDEIKIVDEAGNEVPDGEVGELLARGPYTIRSYYKNPEASAAAFTADGFYRMGDSVAKRGGYLYASGRKKDVINRGGEKISCEEIEDHLHAHPKVASACVVPMPDPVYGERGCAFVIAKPGQHLDFDELKAFMLEREIAKFKIPERLELVAEFPLSPAGKILRRELKRIIEEMVEAESGGASQAGKCPPT
ncbi:MAG: (2,3-dihydroxybenzoyl)adenylate synthase [Alphaproteobacteria bacterium]